MRMLAVFPSHSVARWIDTEWFERERELASDKRQHTALGPPEAEGVRWYSLSRAPRLRYRPFERLLSRLSADARVPQ